jgi:hypothetical protein
MEETTVHGGISTIRKKREIIEDDRFDMFLPPETGIDANLDLGQSCS